MQATKITPEEIEAVFHSLDRSHAVIWFDGDGNILEVNENYCRTMGYRAEEILGKHHRIFVDTDYARSPEYQQFWPRLARGEMKSGEFARVTKDGEMIRLEASYSTLQGEDGRTTKVVEFATNVSERHAKLKSLLSGVSETSDVIAREVETISTTSSELQKRSENQATTVEQTSAAMEEISSTVKSNVKNAEQATAEAKNATKAAEKGSAVVENAIAAMKKIENGSKEIRKFIEVIDSIAFQTNLLALNAGVEAARAGDAGRGFAVVASEVRALAQRASESAKDINALIDNSGREVEEGARLVNETGVVLAEIMEGVTKVSDGIESIFTASREQAGGVNEINQAITSIDKDTQLNATMSQENAETADNLARSSAELIDIVRRFGGRSSGASAIAPLNSSYRRFESVRATPAPPPAFRANSDRINRKISVNDRPSAAHDDEDSWTEF